MRPPSRKVRLISLGAALYLALPLSPDTWTGLYIWTSPFVLLNTLLAGHAPVILHGLALTVLVLIAWSHRWYCRWMCPAGVLCDAASGVRKAKADLARVPEIGRVLLAAGLILALLGVPLAGVLDPLNLFNAFFDAFRGQPAGVIALKASGLVFAVAVNFAAPHVWCRKICPLGALQDMLTALRARFLKKDKAAAPFMNSRRLVLGALAAGGLKLALYKTSGDDDAEPVRPPGALPAEQFKTACLRCGNCGKACPTGIIQSSFDPADLTGLLTPCISFENGYCLPECTVCGAVCSSGAIRKFSREDKKRLVMGAARIQTEGCLLTAHRECDLCRRYCAYDAVTIRQTEDGIGARPEVIASRCTGCGACQVVCPVSVIRILPV